MPEKQPPQRDTLFVEDAKILLHDSYPGDQYVLRVQAPECAARALPGSFVHLQCDPSLLMRRPLSLHPDPPTPLTDIRLSARQRQIVTHLRQTRYTRDLLRQCTLPRDEVLRTLAALVVMGVVVIRKRAVDRDPLETEIAADLAEVMESEPEHREQPQPTESEAVVLSAPDARSLRNEIAAEHMAHREQNAFEFLGIDADARG